MIPPAAEKHNSRLEHSDADRQCKEQRRSNSLDAAIGVKLIVVTSAPWEGKEEKIGLLDLIQLNGIGPKGQCKEDLNPNRNSFGSWSVLEKERKSKQRCFFFYFFFILVAATCVKNGVWGCQERIQEISVKYNRSCQTLSRGQTRVTIMCVV